MADEIDPLPELDPELAALVSAYEASTARDAAQVEAALGRVTAEVGTAGSAAAAGGLSTAAKVGIAGVLVAVVGVVGVVASGPSSDATSRTPTVAADEGAKRVEAPTAIDDAPAAVDSAPAPIDDASVSEAPVEPIDPPALDRRTKPRAKRPAEPPSAPADTLKAELDLLQQARSALRGGRAQQALEIVQRHRREYPSSRVSEERDATEVSALCALDRDDEARAKAAIIERRSARSADDLLRGCR